LEDFKVLLEAMLDVQKSAAAINTQVKQIQRMVSSSNTKIKIDAEINPLKTETLETNIRTAQARIQGFLKKYGSMAPNAGLSEQWSRLFDESKLVKTQQGLANISAKMRLLVTQSQAFVAETNKAFTSEKLTTQISTAQVKIQALAKQYSETISNPALKDSWSKLVDESKLVNTQQGLTSINSKMRLLIEQSQAFVAETNKAFTSDKLSTQISTAQIKIKAFAKQYSAIMTDPALKDAWSKLVDESKLITSKEQLELFNAKMGEFNQKVIAAGKATRSFGDELKNNIVKMGSWMLLGGLIASVVRQFKEVYTNVVAVNTAMVSLRKVANETDETYSAFLDRTAKKAVELSASIAGLVEATANFARLGYSLQDAEMLGQVAVMYKNVGDGVESVDVATSTVISTMKAFGYTANDSMLIIDKLNEVGNNFAVSSSGIGDALQRSSAAMANAGNSLDQTIGLIVAANNVIQDPDVVGKHMCPAA